MRYLILLLLFSCSEESHFYVQPELYDYYLSFKSEANKRGVIIRDENLIMTIEEGMVSKYGGNGVTRVTKDQTYIYIDKAWFDKRGELIEMTVFHELGHAKLGRDHTKRYSLMNPEISASTWPVCIDFVVCKDVIIDELFKPI